MPTVRRQAKQQRAVMGGTGKFSGARGWVDSIHLDDGTWKHVFHIE